MTIYTHTPEQHSAILTARLQLIDLGDEKTAATLAWALTAEPDDAQTLKFKRLPDGDFDLES